MTHHTSAHDKQVTKTESEVLNHLANHDDQKLMSHALDLLKQYDAKHGRNFHKDLATINQQLHWDMATKDLPTVTICENGRSYDIRSDAKPAPDTDSQPNKLPAAVQQALDRDQQANKGIQHVKGGRFTTPHVAEETAKDVDWLLADPTRDTSDSLFSNSPKPTSYNTDSLFSGSSQRAPHISDLVLSDSSKFSVDNAFWPFSSKPKAPISPQPEASESKSLSSGSKPLGPIHGDKAPSRNGFAVNLLERLRLPVTSENMSFLDAWQKCEGGSAENPFNTTQRMPGHDRTINHDGVKRYDSMSIGLEATAKTLAYDRYHGIMSALKRGTSAHACARALAQSKWGTGDLVSQIV